MQTLNLNPTFIALMLELRNEDSLKDNVVLNMTKNDRRDPILMVEDTVRKNTCSITYSRGADHYKVEHWGGIANTAFNIGNSPELVLTTVIQNTPGYKSKIKETICRSFQYDTNYYHWILAGNKPKILAIPFGQTTVEALHETHVIAKGLEAERILVTNKRNQSFVFTYSEFKDRFEYINPLNQ